MFGTCRCDIWHGVQIFRCASFFHMRACTDGDLEDSGWALSLCSGGHVSSLVESDGWQRYKLRDMHPGPGRKRIFSARKITIACMLRTQANPLKVCTVAPSLTARLDSGQAIDLWSTFPSVHEYASATFVCLKGIDTKLARGKSARHTH